ncbi:RsmB/NOP family class I SAM-dependent RNA methyltransferase [Desulfolutivibrio sp.]|uniref:RsmB/NOP family class I SAM-dependent RNA methyltransferase n=1 Tax=Desulfolutivibrio sp. TaxID=2773296 RepID=UPI002F96983D
MDRPGRRTSTGPRSFRLVCRDGEIPLVEDLLAVQGFRFAPEPFSPHCRRLAAEPFPLGASLAATFGLIYIQDRSSMLPPVCLDPPPAASVLDMCASPGGKTGFLAQLVGPAGFVLGNEPTPDRLSTLRRNLSRLNLVNVATCGETDLSPFLPQSGFRHILLDPPCSGWGTAAKNPKVLTLWREGKVAPLISLQGTLLATAASLLAPGGRLLYSTCTTNPAENEDQVRRALDTLPLELVPLTPPPGTAAEPTSLPGVLRVDPALHGGQGFFLACLTRPPQAGEEIGGFAAAASDQPEAGGFDLSFGRRAGLRPGREKGRGPDRRKGREGGGPVDREAFEVVAAGAFPGTEGLDFDALGPGQACRFGDRVYFIAQGVRPFLGSGLRYKGFFLGVVKGGAFRPNARARLLLGAAGAGGASGLTLENPADLGDLLAGRSLSVGPLPKRCGLYYKELPLGFITCKGGRALWSERA